MNSKERNFTKTGLQKDIKRADERLETYLKQLEDGDHDDNRTPCAENSVQALALSGSANMLAAKDFLTPLKFYAVWLAAFLAVLILLIALAQWTQRKRN